MELYLSILKTSTRTINSHVIILGYMASGKSSLAKYIGNLIGLKYIDLDDFILKASSEEMAGFLKGINKVAKKLGISTEVGEGYRALANISDHGGQEVLHLHFHLFGGEKVGKMVE